MMPPWLPSSAGLLTLRVGDALLAIVLVHPQMVSPRRP